MGCDIHFYVERREGDHWVSADTWKKSDDLGEWWKADEFYDDRNYNLFAILADVRNGRGFAGIKTGEGFNPISEPRGLPDDASLEVKRCAEQWSGDGHSHSWLTVKEIMDFDWTQVTTLQGIVTPEEYADWSSWRRGRGEGPRSWCGDRSGPGVTTISEEELAAKIKEAVDGKRGPEYTQALQAIDRFQALITWETPYYRSGSNFLGQTLPRLWRLGKPEDVRCVFWFDN